MLDMYRVHQEEAALDIFSEDTRDFLKKRYPAVMADKPFGVSENYQFMSTVRIAELLQERFDLRIAEVNQQYSRARSPEGQEHYLRFRLPNSLAPLDGVGDSHPELVLTNSHNGRSRIRVKGGIYRLVCDNGLVVSDQSFGAINLRHFGEANTFSVFEELLKEVGENFKSLDVRLHAMKNKSLSKAQQSLLAMEMIKRRKGPDWIESKHVLKAQRDEDETGQFGKRDLWTTFNVIQENLIRSGAECDLGDGKVRKLPTIRSSSPTMRINNQLWEGLDQFCTTHFKELAPKELEAAE